MSDSYGNSFVSIACKNNDMKSLRMLIKGGFDVQTTDRNGNSSLSIAIDQNRKNMVILLLSSGALLTEEDRNRNSCSCLLVKKPGLALSILESTDIPEQNWNGTDRNNSSTLSIAIKNNELTLAQKLILAGVDVNSSDRYGKKCVEIAHELHYDRLVKLLVQHGAHEPAINEQKHKTHNDGDMNIVQSMNSNGQSSQIQINDIQITGFGVSASLDNDFVSFGDIKIDIVQQRRMTHNDFKISIKRSSNGISYAILEIKNKIICTPGSKITIKEGRIEVGFQIFMTYSDSSIQVTLHNNMCSIVKNDSCVQIPCSSVQYFDSKFFVDSKRIYF